MAHAQPIQTDAFGILSQTHAPVAAHLAVRFAIVLTAWATRRRTRLALAQLEPWQLRDVGLTPEEADVETRRVFWQR